ncbi:Crp/Fnr family transcriptional regulator [Flavobacteriales bacterium]|nr:Crp/Fnr family transcriptional regulator [Flavobacteriales bacterium]
MKKLKLLKGDVLQRKGDSNSKVFLVEQGLLYAYIIDEKGKEHIFMFAPKGWIVADISLIPNKSELYIEAIEDSIVIEKERGSEINEKSIEKFERRIAVLQNRIIMLMSASAIERYDHFIKTYPQIVQRVPQRMIASYLGITPEALSKVKSANIKNNKK